MILNYKEAIQKYKNDYQLNKALKNKEIYKNDIGIYSDQQYLNHLQIINKKYPNAVFVSDSAYYYHNLTDVIPQKYYLATYRKSAKINDNKIMQIYISKEIFETGITSILVNGIEINIYDKEKLLIELIKNSKKIPLDYYKEIINNYRSISESLDINKISEYLNKYKNNIELFDKIQKEVF